MDDQLRDFNNTHPNKVDAWYQISGKSKKKLWILLLVIIVISIAGNYLLNKEHNKKPAVNEEKR